MEKQKTLLIKCLPIVYSSSLINVYVIYITVSVWSLPFHYAPQKGLWSYVRGRRKCCITFHKHTVYSYIKGLLMQKTFLLKCIPIVYSSSPLTLSIWSLPINYAPQKILWSKVRGRRKRLCRYSQTHSLLIFKGFSESKKVMEKQKASL